MAATGLTRASVIAVCDDLVRRGWIRELEHPARRTGTIAKAGRPGGSNSTPWQGCVLGVDIGSTKATWSVADLRGTVLGRQAVSFAGTEIVGRGTHQRHRQHRPGWRWTMPEAPPGLGPGGCGRNCCTGGPTTGRCWRASRSGASSTSACGRAARPPRLEGPAGERCEPRRTRGTLARHRQPEWTTWWCSWPANGWGPGSSSPAGCSTAQAARGEMSFPGHGGGRGQHRRDRRCRDWAAAEWPPAPAPRWQRHAGARTGIRGSRGRG